MRVASSYTDYKQVAEQSADKDMRTRDTARDKLTRKIIHQMN